MRWIKLIALAPLLLAAGSPYTVRLSTRSCLPIPVETAQTLGTDWAALAKFAQRCTVIGPDKRPALTVDVIRLDLAFKIDFFASHLDQQVPQPIIRDRAGNVVGKLVEQFPVDPPGRMRVTFARWQGGWPHEIRLYQAGESAIAPHAVPPMRWNASSRTFIDTE